MKLFDRIVGASAIAIGLVWFAAAQFAYDGGSPYENRSLMLGMLAVWYVPPATMYLVKSFKGGGVRASIVAGVCALLVMWAMLAVDEWTRHFKPNCDHCHIPAGECLAVGFSVTGIVVTLFGFADFYAARLIGRSGNAFLRVGIFRRAARMALAFLFALIAGFVVYWILYVVLRLVWFAVR